MMQSDKRFYNEIMKAEKISGNIYTAYIHTYKAQLEQKIVSPLNIHSQTTTYKNCLLAVPRGAVPLKSPLTERAASTKLILSLSLLPVICDTRVLPAKWRRSQLIGKC